MKDLKIYFATDIHGSEKCFKKFIKAGQFYNCDVVIMGGDLTGKGIVPFVKDRLGAFNVEFLGQRYHITTNKEKNDLEQLVRDVGFYPYVTDIEEVNYINKNRDEIEKLYSKLCKESLLKWMELIEKFNKDNRYTYYISPGNDDPFEVDDILNSSKCVINPEGKMVTVKDEYYMVSLGYSNKTPWNTAREASEEELESKIDVMMKSVPDNRRCIFNFHCPPYQTNLDIAPALDETLKQKSDFGQLSVKHVGSKAVKAAILKYSPLLGLHGHIHESRGTQKIGKTLCLNPGSEYTEGILRGVIVVLGTGGIMSGKKAVVKNYMHVSG
jgi:Icc-related predicted phosphoesterase